MAAAGGTGHRPAPPVTSAAPPRPARTTRHRCSFVPFYSSPLVFIRHSIGLNLFQQTQDQEPKSQDRSSAVLRRRRLVGCLLLLLLFLRGSSVLAVRSPSPSSSLLPLAVRARPESPIVLRLDFRELSLPFLVLLCLEPVHVQGLGALIDILFIFIFWSKMPLFLTWP